ncbi:NAC domain-containing protein 83-like [Solanum lycopersicum]|uniref:NAC domain-containing protein 83-like n=1 Tax=Solanum lycopersicum TaxID=4081 RepID=UPI000532EC4A
MDLSNYEYDRQWKNMLPMGFHFIPTEKELDMYLKLKASNGYIPPGIFTNLDIYEYEPHHLSGFAEKHCNGRMYFFTYVKMKFGNGNKIARNLHSGKGYWKSTQARKNIEENDNTIGTKTPLTYYKQSPNNSKAKKTSWLMSEIRLPINSPLLNNKSDYELTLCVIYYKKGKKKNDNDDNNDDNENDADNENEIEDDNENDDDQFFNNLSSSNEYLLQQYQPLVDVTDIASTSTMQPISFSHQLPFDHNYSTIQNHNLYGYDPNIYPYLNYDNSTYIGDEKIDSNTIIVDPIDQNTLEICVAPVSQDDQKPSIDNQDYDDHQQFKTKKIKR